MISSAISVCRVGQRDASRRVAADRVCVDEGAGYAFQQYTIVVAAAAPGEAPSPIRLNAIPQQGFARARSIDLKPAVIPDDVG